MNSTPDITGHATGSGKGDGQKGTLCLLPSLLTTASLFSGFYAIVSAINGQFDHAAVAIIISVFFDGMDGRVARLTGTTSRFGMEYDSLCDLVAFGVAPALVAYLWVLKPYGRYGWLAAFLYVATTSLRLARFNTQSSGAAKKFFTGLPCPAAGSMIATTILFCSLVGIDGPVRNIVFLLLVYSLSYLMVSSIPYYSFKQPEMNPARKFQIRVAMVLLVIVIASEPQVTLFLMGAVYVLSGPLVKAYSLVSRRKEVLAANETDAEVEDH